MATGAAGSGIGTLGAVGAGSAVAVVVAGGLYLAGVFTPAPDPQTQPEPAAQAATPEQPAPAASAEAPAATPQAGDAPAPQVAALPQAEAPADTPADSSAENLNETTPEAQAAAPQADDTQAAEPQSAEPQSTEPQAPLLEAPTFDVVRVEPDGSTLVAGQGTAGSDVAILLDGSEIDRQVADTAGKFVSFLFLEPSTQVRVLTLLAELGDARKLGPDQIILAPTPVAVAEADTASEPATPEADSAAAQPSESQGSEPAPAPVQQAQTQPSGTQSGDEAETVADAATEGATEAPASDPATQTAQAEAQNQAETAAAEPASSAAQIPAQDSDAASGDTPAAPSQVASEAAPADQADPAQTETAQSENTQSETAPQDVQVTVNEPAEPGADPTPDPTPAAASASPDQPAAPAPAPVTILKASADGVEVLQTGAADRPAVMDTISLDTISYSEAGEVQLSGRARQQSVIRIYLDNRSIAELKADDEGRWRAVLNGIEPGVYTLRLDQVNALGKVVSRIETPFKREAPEVLKAAQPDQPPGRAFVGAVTVQKGDTLWAISRESYGEGVLYVRLFEANRDSIRNPDLIYPGQVFTIPN